MIPEQFLVLALFLVIALVNFVVHYLRRQAQKHAPPEGAEEAEDVERPRRVPPRVVVANSPPETRVPPAPSPVAVAARPPGERRRPAFRIGGRRELRRAIVLMTVLGPCRAREAEESK